jgi:PKHD-type hydroxylase
MIETNNYNYHNSYKILNGVDIFRNTQQILKDNFETNTYTLQPYCSEFPLFSEKECKKLIKIGKSKNLEYQQTSDNVIDLNIFNSRGNYIMPSEELIEIYEKIGQTIVQINKKFWLFNLFDFGEPLKFLEYNETFRGFATLHSDLGPKGMCRFRKLTIIIQLSDENSYEGGDLILIVSGAEYKMSRKRGTIIIFPSFVLHKVEPVTKGIRNSLVTFAYGPPFC